VINLVKLSVGSENVETLQSWIEQRSVSNKKQGMGAVHDHVTRMFPRRTQELLNGGSIYWVIKGFVLARQKILRLDEVIGSDGIKRCALILDPVLILTEAQSRRAFQGWRYLSPEAAPLDLVNGRRAAIPSELQAELAILGLL